MLAHGIFSTTLSLLRYSKFWFSQDLSGLIEILDSVHIFEIIRTNFYLVYDPDDFYLGNCSAIAYWVDFCLE